MTGADKLYDDSTVSEHNESDRVWGGISADKINKVREGFIRVCLKGKRSILNVIPSHLH